MPVIVLHSTEGSTAEGAIATLRQNNSMSHDVLDVRARRVHNLLPYDQPARSLRDLAGGVRTNRRGGVVQVEIVGFASTYSRDKAGAGSKAPVIPLFNNDELTFLAHYLRWVCAVTGTPYTFLRRFQEYPASFGLKNPNRMSPEEWQAASGICGHAHVPENDHGDPGALNVPYLEKVGLSIPVQEGPDMNAAEFAAAIGGTLINGVVHVETHEGPKPFAAVLGWTYDNVRREDLLVARIDAAIEDEAAVAAAQAAQAAASAPAEAVADELAARLAE